MQVYDIAILILRLIVGLLFFGHGTQKLFGWFGGGGLENTAGMFGKMNVAPARLWALVAGLSEALGGLGLALGLITPLAAALIVGVMVVAILRVHLRNGLWNSNRGIEYPLVNLSIATFIGVVGPGIYSIDALLQFDYSTGLTFLLSLIVILLGVAISLASGQLIAGRRGQTPQKEQ
jgi:putative oxidoreductase